MTNDKVNAVLNQYKDLIPEDKILYFKNTLAKSDEDAYDNISLCKTKSPMLTIIFSIFLGGVGVDRFYIGDIGLGVAKFLFGGFTFGLWWLIDIFCCYKKVKEKNLIKIVSIL